MTLSEILTWIGETLPTGYFTSTLTSTKLTQMVNEVQKSVCRRHNFSWMKRECTQSTVDGQQRYDLPDGTQDDSNAVRIWRFKQDISAEIIDFNSGRRPLTKAYKKDMEHDPSFADTSLTGIPTFYAVDQFDVWLFLPPKHAYNSNTAWTINLEYYGYIPDLSSTVTTSFLSQYAEDVLKWGAIAKAFEIGEDYDKSSYWQTKANALVEQLVAEDLQSDHGTIETGLVPLEQNSVGYGAGDDSPQTRTYGGYVDGT